MKAQIDLVRLASIKTLDRGSHDDFADGVCAMEAVAYVAGEPWSDHPECASQVIGVFMRNWNDNLPNDERNELLRPLVPRLVGTRGSDALEARRALMAADWLIRIHTPAWLRLAKLDKQAELLSALPEITSMAQVPPIRGPLEVTRQDAAAAGAAAWAVAGDAAWAAAGAAARDAVWAAAGAAARSAAWAAAGDAAWAAAWAAAGAAVWASARDAAWAAARAALNQTKRELQLSAVKLVERMIDAREAA